MPYGFSCRYDNGKETGTGFVETRFVNLKTIAHMFQYGVPALSYLAWRRIM